MDDLKNWIRENVFNPIMGPSIYWFENLNGQLNDARNKINELPENITNRTKTYMTQSVYNPLNAAIKNSMGSSMWWFENLNGKLGDVTNKLNITSRQVGELPGDVLDGVNAISNQVRDSMASVYNEVESMTKEELSKTNGFIKDIAGEIKETAAASIEKVDEVQQQLKNQITEEFEKQTNTVGNFIIEAFETLRLEEIFSTLKNVAELLYKLSILMGDGLAYLYENREEIGIILSKIYEWISNIFNFIVDHPNVFYVTVIALGLLLLRISFNMFMIFVVGRYI